MYYKETFRSHYSIFFFTSPLSWLEMCPPGTGRCSLPQVSSSYVMLESLYVDRMTTVFFFFWVLVGNEWEMKQGSALDER